MWDFLKKIIFLLYFHTIRFISKVHLSHVLHAFLFFSYCHVIYLQRARFFVPPPPPPTHDSFIFFANVIFHVLTFCSRCHTLNCNFGSWHVRARFLGNVRCKNRIITCEMYVTCSVEFYTGCRNPRSFIEWLNSGIHLSNPKRQWEQ